MYIVLFSDITAGLDIGSIILKVVFTKSTNHNCSR